MFYHHVAGLNEHALTEEQILGFDVHCKALIVTQVSSLLLEGNLFEMKALNDLEVKMVVGANDGNEHWVTLLSQGWEQFLERQTATR